MSLSEDVDEVFRPGGTLERALGTEHRPEQRAMALGVARAFERRATLLAEAGTGTGKTFAYCVPALLSGQKVIISTATRNLQDQIAERDLPRLLSALGVRTSVQVLKGRQNYLCWYRLERAGKNARFRGDRDTLEEIKSWAHTTQTGDRAELRSLPDDYGPWRELDAGSDTCLGHSCPQYAECFVTRARQRAAAAELLIVNHHLYFADLALRQRPLVDAAVLPRADAVIFDEAHAIEDVVTEHFGVSFSDVRLRELVKDVATALDENPGSDPGRLRTQLEELPLLLGRLFLHVASPEDGRGALPSTRGRGDLLAEVAVLSGALERLSEVLPDIGRGAVWQALSERARRMAFDLGFVFAPEPDHADVEDDPGGEREARMPRYARTIEERQKSRTVRALPLSVAHLLEHSLFHDAGTTVLTSATLSLAGDFSALRRRLGVHTAEELLVTSPFDYAKQALILVPPATFPEPSASGYADQVTDMLHGLVEAARGGALLLFTSLAAMRTQAERLRARFEASGYLVLMQGDAPKQVLLERFVADGSGVLFGSQSFWEGVDVPGSALRLVVIDKLPFASPGDPLLAARIADAEQRGENAFATFQLAAAVLALRQGFGRLVRSKQDHGVVAILDARLRKRSYGKRFLHALPPATVVNAIAPVSAFFAALRPAGA